MEILIFLFIALVVLALVAGTVAAIRSVFRK